jgi:hypothetical protein
MTSPAVGLAAVGTVALTEGVKFLYTQAGELIKWWRTRKQGKQEESAPQHESAKVEVTPPASIMGGHFTAEVDVAALGRLEGDLRALRASLGEFAHDVDQIDPQDGEVFQHIDALRQSLEIIYGTRLTFEGEQRDSTQPIIRSAVEVERVAGYVAGVRARNIRAGQINSKMKIGDVTEGGEVVSVDITDIGRD